MTNEMGAQKLRTEIIEKGLCSGCGACAGICPSGAISFSKGAHEPNVDEALCIGCGLCFDVCPGKGYPIVKWIGEQMGPHSDSHPTCGPVRGFWLGHSTNREIRREGTSGGIVTSLLLHLLDTDQVDAVVVVTLEDGYPAVHLTNDPRLVIQALGSKYSPVPVMQLIRELRRKPIRIAMSFTPCQLAAFRYASELDQRLAKCLILSIGLFCGYVNEYESVSSIAATLGIHYPREAEFLGWRCGPYPGSARFRLPDGTIRAKPYNSSMDISIPYYALKRCFLCPDWANWLSDITVGDVHAYGLDESIIVSRTERGEQVLRSAEASGDIELTKMTEQMRSVVAERMVSYKLLPALARIAWLDKKRSAIPEYDYPAAEVLSQSPWPMRFLNVLQYRLCLWVRKGRLGRFLLGYPRMSELVGRFLRGFPSTVPGFSLAVWVYRSLLPKRPAQNPGLQHIPGRGNEYSGRGNR